MAKVFITNCITSEKNPKVEVTNVDVNGLVHNLKAKVSSEIDCPINQIEIVYGGQCMDNDHTLNSYGVKNGSTIYALKSPIYQEHLPSDDSSINKTVISQSVHALLTAIRNPSFRSKISNLKKDNVLNDIIAVTPGLGQDHTALNFLQDPELLMQLIDKATMTRVFKAHPCLVEAIGHVTAAVHDESGPSHTSGYSYSLNGLSDDEDDAEEIGASQFAVTSRNDSGAAITSAQLASALAAVGATNSSDSEQSSTFPGRTDGQASSSGVGSSSQPIITSDIFSEAMQQALSGTSETQNSAPNTQAQLEQLRAMGITDDALSVHALELTGGNVQAALELIFSDLPGAEPSGS